MHQDLLNPNWGCQDGLSPYILGNKGYPLLNCFMVSHKEKEHIVLEALYDRNNK
jgi:hypothetical protein